MAKETIDWLALREWENAFLDSPDLLLKLKAFNVVSPHGLLVVLTNYEFKNPNRTGKLAALLCVHPAKDRKRPEYGINYGYTRYIGEYQPWQGTVNPLLEEEIAAYGGLVTRIWQTEFRGKHLLTTQSSHAPHMTEDGQPLCLVTPITPNHSEWIKY